MNSRPHSSHLGLIRSFKLVREPVSLGTGGLSETTDRGVGPGTKR